MSQESTNRPDGDLRETGMSLRHDREWDYELDRITDAVAERDATSVGQQFPEVVGDAGPAPLQPLGELEPD